MACPLFGMSAIGRFPCIFLYIFLKDIFHGICFCAFDPYSPIFPKQKKFRTWLIAEILSKRFFQSSQSQNLITQILLVINISNSLQVDIFLFLNDLRRTGGIFRKSKALEYFDRKIVFCKTQTFGDTKSKK